MSFNSVVTNEAIDKARIAQANPDLYELTLIPYKFFVYDSAGALSVTRDINSLGTEWYSEEFSSIQKLEGNKLLHIITIPPDAAAISKTIAEICFVYKNGNDEEFLYSVIQPSSPLTFTPGILLEYQFAYTLNNTNVADIYTIEYLNPQDIEQHNIDPTAHAYLLARDGSRTATAPLVYDGVAVEDFLNPKNIVSKEYVDSRKNLTTYCANSGNTDANGYPDIIYKESNTEISFKIGDSYDNLHITFPNGNHYEVSSVPNITGISSDGNYIIVAKEENFASLGDGTYSAIFLAVSLGYTAYGGKILPLMSSISQDGITLSTSATNFDASELIRLTDNDLDSSLSGVFTGDYIQIALSEAKSVYRLITSSGYNTDNDDYSVGGVLKGSNNNVDYTTIYTASYSSDYRVLLTIDFTPSAEYLYFRWYPTGSPAHNLACISTFNLYEYTTYAGGNITEGYTVPNSPSSGDLNLLINQLPMLPQLYNGTSLVENQFVKIGEITKDTGVIGDPITYAYNGEYISPVTSINTVDTSYNINHNLGISDHLYKVDGLIRKDSSYKWGNFDTSEATTAGYSLGQYINNYNNILSVLKIGSVAPYTPLQENNSITDSRIATSGEVIVKVKRSF